MWTCLLGHVEAIYGESSAAPMAFEFDLSLDMVLRFTLKDRSDVVRP